MVTRSSSDEMNDAGAELLDRDDDAMGRRIVHVQLLHVPDCPLVDRVRATLRSSLSKTDVQITFEEIEGLYPSPTLLIDGTDATGRTPPLGPCCRLDLPAEDEVIGALNASRCEHSRAPAFPLTR